MRMILPTGHAAGNDETTSTCTAKNRLHVSLPTRGAAVSIELVAAVLRHIAGLFDLYIKVKSRVRLRVSSSIQNM